MLNKWFVRKFTLADCEAYIEETRAAIILTKMRLSRLQTTKAKNPGWAAYDKYADDIVGIDIRIEEQTAVSDELEGDLGLINERKNIIIVAAAVNRESPKPGRYAVQLGFFDTAKKRERIGVLC